ncbi:MAG: histidine phosphatase family protein [Limimaricola sp.]|uniref:SixA phosphatase family protein n=1 Tax=Limimaricola sp. TaxID=2211665 RepID=UPI001E051798|nr:histidine phosphatase family protein [Limimaricola sp.]MBI1415623.1 histidine phosphatase family protein [Limimaricola sp.]
MTLRLILTRHAKSSWATPGQEDHARPLAPRGRAAATAIGHWLAVQRYLPDLVLCSSAVRTQQTLSLILPGLPRQPVISARAALYHASPSQLREIIRRETAPCLMLVGHNPGIGLLAAGLVTTPPRHERFDDYPTAATTVIDFAVPSWADITTGTCVAFVTPHDLNAAED